MANVAEIYAASSALPHAYLGPATVKGSAPCARVTLALRDGTELEAEVALAFQYEPGRGDTVLCIGNEEGFYVIGVLATAGRAVMTFPGDLELRAAGELTLRGEDGVRVEGPSMQVEVGRLELAARAVSQRFHSLRQTVTDLMSLRAGKTHTVVEGSSYTRAHDATLLTKDKVSINGKAIHLG